MSFSSRSLKTSGLIINEKNLKIVVREFIADTPVKLALFVTKTVEESCFIQYIPHNQERKKPMGLLEAEIILS